MNVPDDLSGPRQADYEALVERFGQDAVDDEIRRVVAERLSALWNNRESVEIND